MRPAVGAPPSTYAVVLPLNIVAGLRDA